ncbi:MAG TPA: LytTR family DNA-binding domain-containing protein [Terriglobales bacterium]|nr:LytTR family DNA-binding domain-containing protein [Terriglobales bacterium]
MDLLRVVIVDDEPLARARVRRLLAEIGGAEVVGEAGSAAEARRVLVATAPDAILLDIQMPVEDGFALLASLERRPAVIFLTAYDQYAVRAFEENAVDYLLKPFRRERLVEALERARRALADPAELSRRLERLLGSLSRAEEERVERLVVRLGNRQLILRASEVMWFAAEAKLVVAATAGKRHYVDFTLDQLEQRLDPRHFVRIHRAVIVNLDYAAALRPGFAGTWRLQLKDEAKTELPVSRARARRLREKLGA